MSVTLNYGFNQLRDGRGYRLQLTGTAGDLKTLAIRIDFLELGQLRERKTKELCVQLMCWALDKVQFLDVAEGRTLSEKKAHVHTGDVGLVFQFVIETEIATPPSLGQFTRVTLKPLRDALGEINPITRSWRFREHDKELSVEELATIHLEILADLERYRSVVRSDKLTLLVDETGDTGPVEKEGTSKFLVTTALAVRTDNLESLCSEVTKLATELHMIEIKSTSLDKLKPKNQKNAKDRLDQLIGRCVERAWVFAQRKVGHFVAADLVERKLSYTFGDPYEYDQRSAEIEEGGGRHLLRGACQILFENFRRFCDDQGAFGTICFDAMNTNAKNTTINDSFQDAFFGNSDFDLKLQSGQDCSALSLPDYFCKEILKRLEGKESRWQALGPFLPPGQSASAARIAMIGEDGKYGVWDLATNDWESVNPD